MRTDSGGVWAQVLPFRLDAPVRQARLEEFNGRAEIGWYGFEGSFEEGGHAIVKVGRLQAGLLGGGGGRALNGGAISAGFDAACVLAGLAHLDSGVVITLELSTRFLHVASLDSPLAFRAGVVRSSRNVAFAQAALASDEGKVFAMATALLAPSTGPARP